MHINMYSQGGSIPPLFTNLTFNYSLKYTMTMTRQKIQIRLAHLKTLVETAKRDCIWIILLSDTIEISMDDPTDCHLGSV